MTLVAALTTTLEAGAGAPAPATVGSSSVLTVTRASSRDVYCASPFRSGLAMLVGTWLSSGCAGSAALMHPAHTLPQNRVSFGAGVSSEFAVDDSRRIISDGRALAEGQGTAMGQEQVFVDGALGEASLAPGLGPWVSGRVGLGSDFEAGLTWAGRTTRVDGRRSFEDYPLALSVGLGASAVLLRPEQGPSDPQFEGDERLTGRFRAEAFDFDATGFGFDLPLLVGWRSGGDLFQLWGGPRISFEHIAGEMPVADQLGATVDDPVVSQVAQASATRWSVGGVVGLAVGFSPIWVRFELGAEYHRLDGEVTFAETDPDGDRLDSGFSAFTLLPSGAIVAEF